MVIPQYLFTLACHTQWSYQHHAVRTRRRGGREFAAVSRTFCGGKTSENHNYDQLCGNVRRTCLIAVCANLLRNPVSRSPETNIYLIFTVKFESTPSPSIFCVLCQVKPPFAPFSFIVRKKNHPVPETSPLLCPGLNFCDYSVRSVYPVLAVWCSDPFASSRQILKVFKARKRC